MLTFVRYAIQRDEQIAIFQGDSLFQKNKIFWFNLERLEEALLRQDPATPDYAVLLDALNGWHSPGSLD